MWTRPAAASLLCERQLQDPLQLLLFLLTLPGNERRTGFNSFDKFLWIQCFQCLCRKGLTGHIIVSNMGATRTRCVCRAQIWKNYNLSHHLSACIKRNVYRSNHFHLTSLWTNVEQFFFIMHLRNNLEEV